MSEGAVLIGFDGADPDLIEKFRKKGELPNFEQFHKKGATARLNSTIPPITSTAWNSYHTGMNPGKHGFFDFTKREEGSYKNRIRDPTEVSLKSFSQKLSEQGHKVGMVNIPFTYPPAELKDGFIVAGKQAPESSEYTCPKDLKEKLEQKFDYEIGFGKIDVESEPLRVLRDAQQKATLRKDAGLWLMDNRDWDFYCINFDLLDHLHHKLWHHHDETHFRYEEATSLDCDPILEAYKTADEILGEILAQAGDSQVLVMSDHGGGSGEKYIHLNSFLLENGYMKVKRNPVSLFKKKLYDLGFTPLRISRTLDKFINSTAKEEKKEDVRGLAEKVFLSFEDIDWERTVAYSRGFIGQIYLNKEGREPYGIVGDKDEEKVLEQIINDLNDLYDDDRDQKVVDKTYKGSEIYHGNCADKGADLVVIPRNLNYVNFAHFEFGSNRIVEHTYENSGNHKQDGIFYAMGEGISKENVKRKDIIDIAPTVMYMFDEPISENVDGEPVIEFFEKDFQSIHSVRYTKKEDFKESTDSTYSSSQEKEIEERLEDLGYV